MTARSGAARDLSGAYVALALLTLLWSSNWIVMKTAIAGSDPISFNLQRTLFAIIALFLVLLWQRRPLAPEDWKAAAVTGFFQVTVNFGATTFALASGGAGRTSVLVFTMPFWTLLIAWPVLHERVRAVHWLAVGAAATGMVLVVEPWSWQGSLVPKLWAILSGMGWAAGSVATKAFMRKRALDPINFLAWQMVLGLLPLLVLPLFIELPPTRWTTRHLALVLYVGVIATAFGFLLWLRVLRTLPAGTASLNAFAIPVIALLQSMLIFGERLSASETMGIAAIALGLVIISVHALRSSRLAAR